MDRVIVMPKLRLVHLISGAFLILVVLAGIALSWNGSPRFVCATEVLDLGEIGFTEQRSFILKFSNRGRTPLDVTIADVSCGCTAVRLSRDRIEPGGHGELAGVLTAGRASELLSARVRLTTNDPSRPNAHIRVNASVKADLIASPSVLTMKPDPVHTATYRAPLRITNQSRFPIRVYDIQLKDLSAKVSDSRFDLAPSENRTIEIEVPRSTISKERGELHILSEPTLQRLTVIKVAIDPEGAVTVVPSQLSLGVIESRDLTEKRPAIVLKGERLRHLKLSELRLPEFLERDGDGSESGKTTWVIRMQIRSDSLGSAEGEIKIILENSKSIEENTDRFVVRVPVNALIVTGEPPKGLSMAQEDTR
jgi:hypothetical protein